MCSGCLHGVNRIHPWWSLSHQSSSYASVQWGHSCPKLTPRLLENQVTQAVSMCAWGVRLWWWHEALLALCHCQHGLSPPNQVILCHLLNKRLWRSLTRIFLAAVVATFKGIKTCIGDLRCHQHLCQTEPSTITGSTYLINPLDQQICKLIYVIVIASMGGRHLLHGSGSLRRIHCGCARTNEACHCGISMNPVHVTPLLKEACNIMCDNYMVHFPTFLCCSTSVFQKVWASAWDQLPQRISCLSNIPHAECAARGCTTNLSGQGCPGSTHRFVLKRYLHLSCISGVLPTWHYI